MAQTTISFSTLKTNNSWADGQIWNETKIDAIFGITGSTGLQFFCDDVNDNLDQIRLDCFPSGYAYDNDAAKQFTTANLYEKQNSSDTYSTNITLGTSTDGSFVNVDATNAAITFTPDTFAGDFRVSFQFLDHHAFTANADGDLEVAYRLSDGTNNSNPITIQSRLDGTGLSASDVFEMGIPIYLSHVFSNVTVASTTITLQKRVLTATNVATHDTDGDSNNVIYMSVEKI